MPGIHRELARDESGAQPVSIFQDFQYVMALFLIKFTQSPIIKEQQICLSIASEQFSIGLLYFRSTQGICSVIWEG